MAGDACATSRRRSSAATACRCRSRSRCARCSTTMRVPVAAVLIGRDITEQRLAQASLAEVEARVRESEALANVGSWLWDLRTGTVQWSDEFHRIHGVDPLDFDGTLEAHLALDPPRRSRRGASRRWRSRSSQAEPSTTSTGSSVPTARRPHRPRARPADDRLGWLGRRPARHRAGRHRSRLAAGLGSPPGEQVPDAVDEVGRSPRSARSRRRPWRRARAACDRRGIAPR